MNKLTRRWARRGSRPTAPHDRRTRSAYIFGAICPKEGKGAGLVLASCTAEAMRLHLAEIARAVAPGAHAVVLLDQAGWHTTDKLAMPGQYLPAADPAPLARTQPRREHLAVHPGKLAVQPRLQVLCRHPRSLLLRLERPHRPAQGGMSIGLRHWAHGS